MPANRLDVLRLTAGIVVASLVAACSVGATTAPPSDAPAVSPAAVAASSAPSVSSAPSTAPSVAPTPSSSAVAQGSGGGGRYGPPPTAKPTSKPTSKPTPTPKPAPTLTIKTGSTSLGTVLVTSDGLTLYIHAGDSGTHSTCTGGCASAWPPLLVKAGTKIKGGSGATGMFATFKRADGTTQVTYKGHPLYSWTGDYSPGDTTGQGIGGFSVAKA
jgi:predicted lipoprotein with Yx(FWY)xxD motif